MPRRVDLNVKLKICVVLTACLAFAAMIPGAFALELSLSGGYVKDHDTQGIQNKADELFEREKYKRAHLIYRNDLAPMGDKYAQYMVGFMSLNGLGVSEDPVLASAWFRLAAERGVAQFVKVRDDLIRRLDTVEMDRSDEIYLELRRQYSDIVVRMREVGVEYKSLQGGSTGTRTGSSSSSLLIVRGEGTSTLETYHYPILRRIQKHLDFITRTLEIEPIDADVMTRRRLQELEAQVMDYVSRIDDR